VGYPPFGGNTDEETFAMIEKIEYEFNPYWWRNVPEPPKDLIRGLLAPAGQR